jgi:hypothetical protein
MPPLQATKGQESRFEKRSGNVTNDGLENLAELKGLQILALPQHSDYERGPQKSGHTDESANAGPRGLQGWDAGLKELACLKGLETHCLTGTQTSDAGLKELAGLTDLKSLVLRGTDITSAGLKNLAALKTCNC